MTGKHIVFEIGTMATGAHKDFAGYTNYERFDDAGSVGEFLSNAKRPRIAGKRPTRLGKPGGHFDGSLDIVGEAGDNRYYFSIEPWSETIFAPGQPPILPIGDEGTFIRNVKVWDVQTGKLVELADVPSTDQSAMLVSFDYDLHAAKSGPTAKAIEKSDHATAFKVPFVFNLVDKRVGAPPWTFDDHRYEPSHGIVEHITSHEDDHHDGDHNHDDHKHDDENLRSNNLKLFTHGGIHPDDMASLFTHGGIHPDDASRSRTHGGIHPPGVASFVIAVF